MNTIPLTFNEHQINRMVLGGRQNTAPDALNISVILFDSGGTHYKVNNFENLLSCNFSSIIAIEKNNDNYSIEDVAKKYPKIEFIIPKEETTDGEMINLAMSEISSDYVLVLRDNLYIPQGIILQNLAQRLIQEGIFCVVPRLLDKNKNGLSTRFNPCAEKSHFVIDSSFVVTEGLKTVYPFDFIALYNRKKFIQLGGFDYTIKTPYWQNLDLALRSWLFGEKTKLTTMLQFSYLDEVPVEDRTINIDYLRYYLKNELPRCKNGEGYFKRGSFFKFYKQSTCGYMEAQRQYKCAKEWVKANKLRFKNDLMGFIQGWSQSDEN
jgi:hypothetical protein